MTTIKNSYISLNADPTKKDAQPGGVFYDYDENSVYINFNFDDTVDLKDLQSGFVCIRFNTNKKVNDLILDLKMVENANSGFVILPTEYMGLVGTHLGEVNLRYPDNSLTVGRFEMTIEPSIIGTQAKNVDDVYVPRFNETLDMYDDLKK